MARKYKELRERLVAGDPARESRLEAESRALEAAIKLYELRERLRVTQAELAERLGTTQPNISRIEHQHEIFFSTLAEYVHGLGGRLEVVAIFDDGRVPIDLGELGATAGARQLVTESGAVVA